MNYYKILQVSQNASYDEIKQSYKKLALKYHPDKTNGNTSNMFKKISEAYSVISDPYKRGKYDADLNSSVDIEFGSMNMFSNMFKNTFPNMSNIDGNKTSYTYSSSTMQKRGPNGMMNTKKNVHINNNGKQQSYYKEYNIDKDGRKYIIKDTVNGNKKYLLKK